MHSILITSLITLLLLQGLEIRGHPEELLVEHLDILAACLGLALCWIAWHEELSSCC